MNNYSTRNISINLLEEIKKSLHGLDYGSLELYVNNWEVVQITKRKIKKIKNSLLTTEKK